MNYSRRTIGGMMAASAFSLSSCAPAVRPLRVWAMGVEGEALGRFATTYMAQHPEEKVRVQALPWGAAHEKLLTAFAADDLPDVIALGNTWVAEFAALNALLPLEDHLAANRLTLDGVFEAARRSVSLDGHVLGVPWYVDTRLLFYRPDLLRAAGFPAPPVTWTEWDAQMTALAHRRPDGHSLLMPINEYEPLVALCLQAGVPLLLDNATRGGFTQGAVRTAFAYAASLYQKGFAEILTSTQVPDLYSGFARGDYAFVVSGPWNLGEFTRRMPADVAWATAPMPGPAGPGASLSGGVSLSIPRKSRDPDRAFAFIRYLCAPEQQAALHAVTGDLPADAAAWPLAGLDHDARALAFHRQMTLAQPAPPAPEWERIANEMAAALERVVRRLQPLDAALSGLDRFADTVLAKRRSMLRQKGAA